MKNINIGDVIGGRFKILKAIGGEGKSGMGIVYISQSLINNTIVALKTFQERFKFSEDIIKSFKHEALAWIQLGEHQNIVTAFFVQYLDSKLFIGLDCIFPDEMGRNNLTHYLSFPISLSQSLTWGIEFCRGMEHAYSQGISCHRDIKPDNIMITNNKTLKITDFGLVKLWEDSNITLESMNNEKDFSKGLSIINTLKKEKVVGTPPWMAPEQFEGITDIRSDIYSFGIVLFQMVNNGQLPYICWNLDDYYKAHKEKLLPKFDSKINFIITKCLQKLPENRYQDFKELRLDLEKVYKNEINENIPSPLSLSISNNLDHGISYLNLNMYDEALRLYIDVLKEDPNDFHANLGLGICFMKLSQLDKAEIHLKKAVNLDSKQIEPYINLGNVYQLSKRYEAAISMFTKATGTTAPDPKIAHAYSSLGKCLAVSEFYNEKKKKKFKKAIQFCEKAIQLNPKSHMWYIFLNDVYHFRADYFTKSGHPREARADNLIRIQILQKALDLNPLDESTLMALGIVYNLLELNTEAIQICTKLLEENPNQFVFYTIIAFCYKREKNYKEALKWFQKFLKVAPPERYQRLFNATEEQIKTLRPYLKEPSSEN